MFNGNKGEPICEIEGSKYDGTILYKDADNYGGKNSFNNLKLRDGKLQLIPDFKKNRCYYITGSSGSGKSWFIYNALKKWKEQKGNKNKPIYLFSSLEEDESLDKLKPLRIKLDESLLTDPIEAQDFDEGSVAIFDDIDVIKNKKIREEVYDIMNQLLQIGRHNKVGVLMTSHNATDGRQTKIALSESAYVVYFPLGGMRMNYLLTEYLNLSKQDIKWATKQKSRWMVVYKNYGRFMMGEKQLRSLHCDDSDSEEVEK